MSATVSKRSYYFIILVLILQAIIYFVVFADMSIARMIICFLYLLFIPGIVILQLLDLKSLSMAEKFLFSCGLSIAFLMIIGVFINEIGQLIFKNPLSLNILLFGVNTTVLLISFMTARRRCPNSPHLPQLRRVDWLLLVFLIISLFMLGFYGTITVRTTGNSDLLLLQIITVAAVISAVFLSGKTFSNRLYPFILFIITICLLVLGGTLITQYVAGGGDASLEYYAFNLTGHSWNSQLPRTFFFKYLPYYSMISITILPVIFSTFTAMDTSFLFLILYPVVVSFLAIGAYKLYETQTDSKTAFLATFFLITVSLGKGFGPYKQYVAEIFYVLLLLVLLKKDISPLKKTALLSVFGASLVLSHYSLTYIFLLTLLFSFLILIFLNYGKTGRINLSQDKIPLTFVILFSTITFSWYIYVNGAAAFSNLLQAFETVTRALNEFFNPASRGTALQGLGVIETTSIYYRISSIVFILTEVFVVIGFIKLLSSKKASSFSTLYKIFATLNVAIIAVNILLPRLADTFLMARFYQITLIILAPLAIVGGRTILGLILRKRFQKFYTVLLVFTVFIPLFLFQTQFVYEVTGDQSYSLPLSGYRWSASQQYDLTVDTQRVVAAQWIPQHTNLSKIVVYSDVTSISQVLLSYGSLRGLDISALIGKQPTSNGLIYISDVSLIRDGYILNASLISPIIDSENKVYSNGNCEIYEGYL